MRIDKLSSIRPHYLAALLLCPLTAVWAAPAADPPATELEAVVTTDLGTFRFEFLPDVAPKHVENFIKLAKEKYYDGSGFFRVGRAYIQGGDPGLKDPAVDKKEWGKGGLDLLSPEFSDVKHERGIVSTYHSFRHGDGAQFFVVESAQPGFDHGFSAFGRVTEGMEIVDRIARAPHNEENGFANDVIRIKTVTIEKKKKQAPVEQTKAK